MAEFAKGLFAKKNEKAPSYVVCDLSFKVDEFKQWLDQNINDRGYVNVEVRVSKEGGKVYAQLDEYQPKQQEKTPF